MYIINERSGAIVNSDFVSEFYLIDTNDSSLVSMRFPGETKPVTLERYKTRKEAKGVISQLFQALKSDQAAFRMPESLYYFEERVTKDARTKRKGGS